MKIKMRLMMVALTCLIIGLGTSFTFSQEVKLGALQDTTGATSDVGKDEAMGVREAVQYYNDSGGINGKKIRLFQYDYGYRVPEAVTTYKRFRDYDKVVMVLGCAQLVISCAGRGGPAGWDALDEWRSPRLGCRRQPT